MLCRSICLPSCLSFLSVFLTPTRVHAKASPSLPLSLRLGRSPAFSSLSAKLSKLYIARPKMTTPKNAACENTQAKRLMRSWAGEHEARYKDEVALLRMVSAKEHVGASEYCQMVSATFVATLPGPLWGCKCTYVHVWSSDYSDIGRYHDLVNLELAYTSMVCCSRAGVTPIPPRPTCPQGPSRTGPARLTCAHAPCYTNPTRRAL